MDTVLVTGATGFIGVEVVRQLVAEGVATRVLVRRPSRAALLTGLDVDLRYGDLGSPTTLRRALEGADTVIHLAARATFERAHVLWPSIVEGTATLAAAAVRAGVESFVYGSSLLVYPGSHHTIGATTRPAPVLGYGAAKVAAENRLLAAADGTQLAPAIIRLPHVYGARDLLFERVRAGLLVAPDLGRQPYTHLHVEDAARVLIAAGRQRWAGALPVGDRMPVSMREFFETVQELCPRARVVTAPAAVARSVAALAEVVTTTLGVPSMVTPGTVTSLGLRLEVDPETLWPDLDLRPRHPTIVEGIPAALDEEVRFRWRHSVADRTRW